MAQANTLAQDQGFGCLLSGTSMVALLHGPPVRVASCLKATTQLLRRRRASPFQYFFPTRALQFFAALATLLGGHRQAGGRVTLQKAVALALLEVAPFYSATLQLGSNTTIFS